MSSSKLPDSWVEVTLEQVAHIETGTTPPTSNQAHYGGGIPFIKPSSLVDKPIFSVEESISSLGEPYARIVPAGSVLVSCIGNLGKTGLTTTRSAFNQQINAATFSPLIEPRFGFYACQLLRPYLESVASATTISIVNKSKFSQASIPLAPLPEQRRIVAAIEEQFTRLDAAVASLQRARANLKRYRAAVLQAAVTGRLSETDAAIGGSKTKYGKAKGSPPDDSSSLPDGWTLTNVESLKADGEQAVLTGPFGSTLGRSDFVPSGVPVLTIGCLTDSGISMDKAVYVRQKKADQLARYRLKAGDVLFSRMASVGRAGLVTNELEGALINYHIMRLRLSREKILPEYFLIYVRGSETVRKYVRNVNHGATRDGINTTQLLGMPVALPTTAEQQHLIDEVARQYSVIESLDSSIDHSLKRAERLRQAILKRAFAGELVPQDPSDEPAGVLLERIRAERAARQPEKRPRAKGRRTARRDEAQRALW